MKPSINKIWGNTMATYSHLRYDKDLKHIIEPVSENVESTDYGLVAYMTLWKLKY